MPVRNYFPTGRLRRPLLLSVLLLTVLATVAVYYLATAQTFFADVYVWYPDGRIERISPSENGLYYQSHLNTAGSAVVFFGGDSGPPRIWKADLRSGQVTALTPPTSAARHPVFSWDGSQIAFAAEVNSGQTPELVSQIHGDGKPGAGRSVNLFVMNNDGSAVRQITFGNYQDQRPCFSPDGSTIAFVSNRDGEMRLWSVASDGSSQPIQLQKQGWGYRPWFSIDGRWIYFFTGMNGRHQIARINSQGGMFSPLANDDNGSSHGPFVNPDGKSLLMHSTRNGQFGIWELPLDESAPRAVQPPGFAEVLHATRSQNGTMAFDVSRRTWLRKAASWLRKQTYARLFPRTRF